MRPIHANRLHPVQAFDSVPILLGKGDITTNVSGAAARFDATYHVPLPQVLIVKTD